MSKANDAFKAPEAPAETDAERVARLRIKAQLQAAQEFDEDAVYAKLLAEERERRMRVISGDEVELPTDTRGMPDDYDWVEIFRGQSKQDLPYVPLSLGGLVIKVPRGRKVILPHAFVEDCLDLCVEDVTVVSQGGYTTRPSHCYPYSFKGKATREEYTAFQEREKAQAQRELAVAA